MKSLRRKTTTARLNKAMTYAKPMEAASSIGVGAGCMSYSVNMRQSSRDRSGSHM